MNEYRSQELNDLFSAISKAQEEMKVAAKDSSNPFFKSKYANLQAIIEAARPSLCKNGLSVVQQIISEESGDYLVTTLGHSSGQWISSKMRIAPLKSDVQSLGSYITYLRRYSYATLVGVYDGEDDDGNEAIRRESASLEVVMKDELVTPKQAQRLEMELFKVHKLEDVLKEYKIDTLTKLKNSQAQDIFKKFGLVSKYNGNL